MGALAPRALTAAAAAGRWAPAIARGIAAQAWEGPAAKLLQRADVLAASGQGWTAKAAQWNTYLTTVAGYVGQMHEAPPPVRQAMVAAATKAFGTYTWLPAACLVGLGAMFRLRGAPRCP